MNILKFWDLRFPSKFNSGVFFVDSIEFVSKNYPRSYLEIDFRSVFGSNMQISDIRSNLRLSGFGTLGGYANIIIDVP